MSISTTTLLISFLPFGDVLVIKTIEIRTTDELETWEFFGANRPCSFIPDRNGRMILGGELIFETFVGVEFGVDTSIMLIDSGFLLKYAKRWINVLPRRKDVDHRITIYDRLGNCRMPNNPFLEGNLRWM